MSIGAGSRLAPNPMPSSRILVVITAVLALLTTVLGAAAVPAVAATPVAVGSGSGCRNPATGAPARVTVHGHVLSGLLRPASVTCARSRRSASVANPVGMSDAAQGTPPLINHGGPVMGTPAVNNEIVLHPIFWGPPGYGFDAAYQDVIGRYLRDIADASNANSNALATTTQYGGSNGQVHNHFIVGGGISDTSAFPTSGCTVNSGSIYADGTGYTECLDDDQVQAEVAKSINTLSGLTDYGHLYILFTPKHVESCFFAGNPSNQQCTLNSTPSGAFCAYHSSYNQTAIYANMPFPIYESATGYTCASEAAYGSSNVEAPNGNFDADTEVSPLSHEIAEAMTDPNGDAWYDSSGNENGDECAYTYGPITGPAGAYYNQTIMADHYLTQEEFSNGDFGSTGGGCSQSLPLTPPAVAAASPTSGGTAGGTSVTITGSHFTYASRVSFGDTPAATFTVNSDSQITAVSPARSTATVDITVTNPDGASASTAADQFAYQDATPAPTVTSISPSSGSTTGGAQVDITGSGFTGATTVSFGGTPAPTFSVTDDSHITATAPAGAPGAVDVTVTTSYGTSTTGAADQFAYVGPPTVTGLAPASGPAGGGTRVTLTGTGLSAATTVDFGNVAATSYDVVDAQHVTAVAPAHAPGTVDVTVSTAYGTSAASVADRFAYVPTISAVTPHAGPTGGGIRVTIAGTGLAGATAVTFGGIRATSFTRVSDIRITAVAPAHTAGTVHIVVTAGGRASVAASPDRYTYVARPVVTAISPRWGTHNGGTVVVVTGKQFTRDSAVLFGAYYGSQVQFVSSTELKVHTRARWRSTVNVYVRNTGGISAAVTAARFTFT